MPLDAICLNVCNKRNYFTTANAMASGVPVFKSIGELCTWKIFSGKKDVNVIIYNITPEPLELLCIYKCLAGSKIVVFVNNKKTYNTWNCKEVSAVVGDMITMQYSLNNNYPILTDIDNLNNPSHSVTQIASSLNYTLGNMIGPVVYSGEDDDMISVRLEALGIVYSELVKQTKQVICASPVYHVTAKFPIAFLDTTIINIDYPVKIIVCMEDASNAVRTSHNYNILFAVYRVNKTWRARVNTSLPMCLHSYNYLVNTNPNIVKCESKKNNTYIILYKEEWNPKSIHEFITGK